MTQEELKTIFSYDSLTGVFVWKRTSRKGSKAGFLHDGRYWALSWKGKRYPAHRMAWVYMHGKIPKKMQIDHINGNKTDNRIENLRLATASQNRCNCPLRSNNKSGYKGSQCRKIDQYGKLE